MGAMSLQSTIMVLTVVFTGLSAGLLFGWRVSVIPGTARSSDRTYIEAMRHINNAIINPLFLLVFGGAPALQFAAVIVNFSSNEGDLALMGIAGFFLYVFGVFGVTAAGNLPLNNRLAAFDLDDADHSKLAAMRESTERPWNRWHNLRTAAAVFSFVLTTIASVAHPTVL